MRCDREGLKRLGAYLGLPISDGLLEWPGAVEIICRPLETLDAKYSARDSARLADIIFSSRFSGLSTNGEREHILSRSVFDRFNPGGGEEEFFDFNVHFRRCLRWLNAAVEAALDTYEIKKEDISLDSPGVRDYVAEFRVLPCRRLGEMSLAVRLPGYAALSRYVEALLARYEDIVLDGEYCRKIVEVMNKVSGHPAYFKTLSAEQKLVEARPLIVAISELQLYSQDEPGKADLLAALGLLLFNVFPAPKLLKFITRLQPSPGNDALLYDYNAILSMNFMLDGRLTEADGYNQKARLHAPDDEKRSYTYIMESCIGLNRGDIETATSALYTGSTLTKDRRMKAMAQFYLGIIQYESGSVNDALESFQLSRVGLEDELDIMSVCNNIGTCALLRNDMKAAATEFENVEYVGRYMTSKTAQSLKSVACGNLGLIHLHRRNYDRAIERFKEALKLDRETHDKKGVVNQLGNIALALKAKNDHKAALEYFKSALNIAFLEDYLEGVLFALSRIDRLMALEGRYDEADAFRQDVIRRNPGIAKMLLR